MVGVGREVRHQQLLAMLACEGMYGGTASYGLRGPVASLETFYSVCSTKLVNSI